METKRDTNIGIGISRHPKPKDSDVVPEKSRPVTTIVRLLSGPVPDVPTSLLGPIPLCRFLRETFTPHSPIHP